MKEEKVRTGFTEQETDCILDLTKKFIECFNDKDEVIDDYGFIILEKLDDWLGRRGLTTDSLFDRILLFVYEKRDVYDSDLLIPNIADAVITVYRFWPDMPRDCEMLMQNSLTASCTLQQNDERKTAMIESDSQTFNEIIQEAVSGYLMYFRQNEFIRRVNSYLKSRKENIQVI